MLRIKIVTLVAVLALVAAACGGDDETEPATTDSGTTGTTGTGALAEFFQADAGAARDERYGYLREDRGRLPTDGDEARHRW